MHARARPASQQPAEFTRQPAASRIHACARAASRIHACERASVPDPKKNSAECQRFCSEVVDRISAPCCLAKTDFVVLESTSAVLEGGSQQRSDFHDPSYWHCALSAQPMQRVYLIQQEPLPFIFCETRGAHDNAAEHTARRTSSPYGFSHPPTP